jgi:TPR repeat protein
MVIRCLAFVRVFLVICLITVCLVALASKANAAARVALVIGNGEYRYAKPLPNPVNDANDIAATLEQLDFTVIRVLNGDFGKIREAIRAFNTEVEHADIGLIYYAGHGMELGGENWIVPIDAELKSDRDLLSEAIGLKVILQSVSRAGALGLVILDSCRDNPFAAKMTRTKLARSVDRGLARVEPTANVLVAYAAKDGTTATDGDGRNSPYTAALLKHLGTRGLEVSFVFRKVRDDVMAATGRRQQPFVYGSLSSKAIYLRAADPAAPAASAPAQSAAAAPGNARNVDVAVWESISRSTDGALFESFLKQFPQSPRSTEAQARLSALRAGGECDQLRADIPRGARERTVTLVESANGESANAASAKPKPDPQAARRACEAAMEAFPDVTRYALQGARAAEENKDYGKAREFYEKAADRGSRVAMVSLGALYESNLAGEPSYPKARSLYQKAVELGEPSAATRLARMYEAGHGLGQSPAQAREWYRKAAALGDAQAMARLADIYERGLGVRKNAAEARMWRRKLAEAKQAATQPAQQPAIVSKPPLKKSDAN